MRHKTILKVGNLSVSRKNKEKTIKLVKNMDFQLEQGGILGIVGESGSGKEILPKAILGLLDQKEHVLSGEVLYLENDILSMNGHDLMKIRGREISHLPADPALALNPYATIGRQVDILRKHLGSAWSRESMDELLVNLGIEDFKRISKVYVSGLGDELAYRILLAMAIASKPKILIVEDPAACFDGLKKKEILVLLKKISIDYRISVIVLTSDFDSARLVCDRIIIMYRGLVIEEGTVNQLLENTRHPYSLGLIKSIESHMGKNEVLYTTRRGESRLDEARRICPFVRGCSRRKFYCSEEMPELTGEGLHKTRCFNPVGGSES